MLWRKNRMSLRSDIIAANKEIVELGLVKLTWGNVSCRINENFLIKPSGVNLSNLLPDQVAEIDKDNILVSGLKQSVDSPAHIEIYKNFKDVCAVVHTHSKFATSFAQSGTPIPCAGTTHADFFRTEIPVVGFPSEVDEYEKFTGQKIASFYKENNLNPLETPAVLCEGHGVFAWGRDIKSAVQNAFVVELVAEMYYNTIVISSCFGKTASPLNKKISEKHFLRKHGKDKYYGQ
jgi:L-ribulose-5-phosphate 4-epimerase